MNTEKEKMTMTPKEIRNDRLAAHLLKQLSRRNMEAFYCKTKEIGRASCRERV